MRRFVLFLALLATVGTASAQRLPDRHDLWAPARLPEQLWQPVLPDTDTVSIFIVGDIMSHRAVSKSAETYGFSSFFRHIEDRIAGADLSIGNLEFPLAGKPYSGYPQFSGPDAYARYLKETGFDVFLTANNHITDKGAAGMSRTLSVLDTLGVAYTGTAASPEADTLLNPLLLHVRGLRIAIVNFTYGTNTGTGTPWPKVHTMNKEQVARMLERAQEADIVLVFPHWGIEYRHRHSEEQEQWARFVVDHGADAVIGAHPHVVQDIRRIGHAPVFYSVGNALSNQNDLDARLELAVTLRIAVSPFHPPQMLEPAWEFLWCTKPGMVEESYSAVPVTLSAEYWRDASDYDNMIHTLEKVQQILHEEND